MKIFILRKESLVALFKEKARRMQILDSDLKQVKSVLLSKNQVSASKQCKIVMLRTEVGI